MGALEKVLSLRPTTAALRLGPSSHVALLNPRDVLRELGPDAAWVVAPVQRAGGVAGIVRAARDASAPVGLRCPHPCPERGAPQALFDALSACAHELSCRVPLFLEGGPVRLTEDDPAALERAAGDVHAFVDAGFGLVAIDATGASPETAGISCRHVAASVLERELALEVAAPVHDGRVQPVALQGLLEGLGFRATFVSVDASALAVPLPGGGQWALDVPLLEQVREIAEDAGASLCVEDRAGQLARGFDAWVDAGVRKVVTYAPFERLEQAPEERWEALSYCEAVEWIERTRTAGSAPRIMAALAARAEE